MRVKRSSMNTHLSHIKSQFTWDHQSQTRPIRKAVLHMGWIDSWVQSFFLISLKDYLISGCSDIWAGGLHWSDIGVTRGSSNKQYKQTHTNTVWRKSSSQKHLSHFVRVRVKRSFNAQMKLGSYQFICPSCHEKDEEEGCTFPALNLSDGNDSSARKRLAR